MLILSFKSKTNLFILCLNNHRLIIILVFVCYSRLYEIDNLLYYLIEIVHLQFRTSRMKIKLRIACSNTSSSYGIWCPNAFQSKMFEMAYLRTYMIERFDDIWRWFDHLEPRLDSVKEQTEHIFNEIQATRVAVDAQSPSWPPSS